MLIVGAKGFAKEVLEIFHQIGKVDDIAFYDDVNADIGNKLYNKFPILKSEKEVKVFFQKYGNEFTIGIGNSILRNKLHRKFVELGGSLVSSISKDVQIGNYGVQIGIGANILSKSIISNSVVIGICSLIYYNSIITHDCKIGDYVELSPNSILLGRVKIGSYTQIGANSTILPDISIGKNVIVGAGSVVTKNIPDNEIWIGNPAKFYKSNKNG